MEALLTMRKSEGLTYRELAEQSGVPIFTLNYCATKFRKEVQVDSAAPEFLRVELLEQEEVCAIPIELNSKRQVTTSPSF